MWVRRLELIERETLRVGDYCDEHRVSILAVAVLHVVSSDSSRDVTTVVQDAHGGLVVRWAEGQLLAVFAEPMVAVRAVVELAAGAVPLRGAIHLAQVVMEKVGLDVDAFGGHAHRTACIANTAQPGEVLATEAVADNLRGLDRTDPSFVFARRGRLHVEGLDHPLTLFALTATRAHALAQPRADAFIELEIDGQRRALFDAAIDRRIVLGRSNVCDVPLREPAASRKHAMILFDRPQWVIHDLESTNGTYVGEVHLTGQRRALSVGDTIVIGETVVGVTDLGLGESTPALRVDLRSGRATYEDRPLPLSAAEFVWFSQLACARVEGEGWVGAGQDGHAALRAFAKPLFSRPWATAVRTRPLLDLVEGREIDDEDLRNLRGKTVQKLKRFGAPVLIPDARGKHERRLPLASAMIEILR